MTDYSIVLNWYVKKLHMKKIAYMLQKIVSDNSLSGLQLFDKNVYF